jgi:hypothetical protein
MALAIIPSFSIAEWKDPKKMENFQLIHPKEDDEVWVDKSLNIKW